MPVSWDAGSKAVSVSTTSTGPISLDGVPAPAFDYSDANQLPMTGYFSKTLTYPDLQGTQPSERPTSISPSMPPVGPIFT